MRVWFLALSFLLSAPISWAEAPSQASPLQPQNAEVPSEPWSLSKASQELVARLIERRQEVTRLSEMLASLEQALIDSEAKSAGLESTLTALRADLTETSNLLVESRTQLADLEAAMADERKAMDAELFAWQAGAVGAGLAAVLAIAWGLFGAR